MRPRRQPPTIPSLPPEAAAALWSAPRAINENQNTQPRTPHDHAHTPQHTYIYVAGRLKHYAQTNHFPATESETDSPIGENFRRVYIASHPEPQQHLLALVRNLCIQIDPQISRTGCDEKTSKTIKLRTPMADATTEDDSRRAKAVRTMTGLEARLSVKYDKFDLEKFLAALRTLLHDGIIDIAILCHCLPIFEDPFHDGIIHSCVGPCSGSLWQASLPPSLRSIFA